MITFPCYHTMLVKMRLMLAVIRTLRLRSKDRVFVTRPQGSVINTWSDLANNGDMKDNREFLAKKLLMTRNEVCCPSSISHTLSYYGRHNFTINEASITCTNQLSNIINRSSRFSKLTIATLHDIKLKYACVLRSTFHCWIKHLIGPLEIWMKF